ncbi:MAG: hypothetical protein IJR45_07850 [Firmicutes bacterium]|nr:hypothetical protein [Bacillota bacterium]MBQ9605311.1 hypothetical protein [Bacillota bacterium]
MGLFDFLKPKKKEADYSGWHAETDIDKFTGIEKTDIESYISRINDGIYEFVILTPSEPINGLNSLVVYKETGFTVELSVTGDHDMNKVYKKGAYLQDEILEVIDNIASDGTLPDIEQMTNLGTMTDPKVNWRARKITIG